MSALPPADPLDLPEDLFWFDAALNESILAEAFSSQLDRMTRRVVKAGPKRSADVTAYKAAQVAYRSTLDFANDYWKNFCTFGRARSSEAAT